MMFHRGLLVLLLIGCGCALSFCAEPSPKSPPPDAAALARSNRAIRDIFKNDIAKARTRAQQIELANKLLQSASEENTSASDRYALLMLAREMSVNAGEVDLAARVANSIVDSFAVDAIKFKLELAQDLDKSIRIPYARSDLVHFFNTLIIDALQAEQFELGRRIASAAQVAARQGDDASLGRLINSTSQRLRDTETAYNSSKKSFITIVENPADPAANLIVGKYDCFYRSDWSNGLPLLARSSDATLKALATRELAAPDKPLAQITLADDWWSVAESSPGSTKQVIQSHAVTWYQKALPELTGLSKARVERRLTEARLASADEGELLPTMIGKFTTDENGVVILKAGQRIKTPETFTPPVVFRIVAQTEKNNIRIAYAAEQIIFNWERNPTELRVDGGPPGGHYKAGAGLVPINTWVTIDLLVRPRVVAVSVDGQLRHEIRCDCSQVNEPFQIFAVDSTLKIKSVRVRQLAP